MGCPVKTSLIMGSTRRAAEVTPLMVGVYYSTARDTSSERVLQGHRGAGSDLRGNYGTMPSVNGG